MNLVPPPARLTPEQWDKLLELRPAAARSALRLGAGNSVGLTHDDLRALADNGIMAGLATFDPGARAALETHCGWRVRSAVLHALRDRGHLLEREVPAADVRRRNHRASLDGLGAGIDPDDYDVFEDTDDDFMQEALGLADDGMLALILGRAACHTAAVEGLLIKLDLLQRLDVEVEGLPPALRKLIRLRFYEARTGEEIAALTGIPRSTVYQQLVAAITLLRLRMRSDTRGVGPP